MDRSSNWSRPSAYTITFRAPATLFAPCYNRTSSSVLRRSGGARDDALHLDQTRLRPSVVQKDVSREETGRHDQPPQEEDDRVSEDRLPNSRAAKILGDDT